MRAAPIEWLYPGVRPPAAGDLLEAKFIADSGCRQLAGTFPTRE
jgi:hypothetical protein